LNALGTLKIQKGGAGSLGRGHTMAQVIATFLSGVNQGRSAGLRQKVSEASTWLSREWIVERKKTSTCSLSSIREN